MDEQRPQTEPQGQRRSQKRSFSEMNAHAPASSQPQGIGADEHAASPLTPLSDLFVRDSLTPPPRRHSPSQLPRPAMDASDTPPAYRSTSRHDPQDVIDLTMDDSPAARPPSRPEQSRIRHEPSPAFHRTRAIPTVIDLESPEQAPDTRPTRPVRASRDASVQTAASIRPEQRNGSHPANANAAAATNEDDDGDVEITSWTQLRPTFRAPRSIRPPPTRHGGRGQLESRAPDTLEPAMSVGPTSLLQQLFGVGNYAPTRFPRRSTPRARANRMFSTASTGSWIPSVPHSLAGLGVPWDFDAAGFDNAEDFFGAGGDDDEEASSTSQLESLPPVREGFTRELNEGDVLVCPNCDRELSAGDQDGDGMVWVVRACGHVYCGACGDKSNRVGRGAKAKGKGRAKEREDGLDVPPLTVCVVDKCASRTTGEKSMFPLYL